MPEPHVPDLDPNEAQRTPAAAPVSGVTSQTGDAARLTLAPGLVPFAVWLIGQVILGAALAALLAPSGEKAAAGSMLALSGMVGVVLAGLAASLWAWGNIRRRTPGGRARMGWQAPTLAPKRLMLWIGIILVIERAFEQLYLLLTRLLSEAPLGPQIVTELVQARPDAAWASGFIIVATVVLVPLFEEIIFRGHMQTTLVDKLGVPGGLILTSFIFAAVHMEPAYMVPLFLLGLAFGLVRQISGSIWPAVLLHMANNGMALLVLGVVG